MASRKQQFWSDYIDGLVEERRPAKVASKTAASKTTITKPAPKPPQTIMFDAQALVRQSRLGNIQATMQLATIKQQLSQRAAAGDVQAAMLLQKIQRLEISPVQPRQMMRQPYMAPGMAPGMPSEIPTDMPQDMPQEMPENMIGEEERELARYGGASERAALARRTRLAGEFIHDSDLRDDEEDEGSPSAKTASAARKGLKGGQESLRSTSRTISQAQTARSQARDVAAATTWAAKLIHK